MSESQEDLKKGFVEFLNSKEYDYMSLYQSNDRLVSYFNKLKMSIHDLNKLIEESWVHSEDRPRMPYFVYKYISQIEVYGPIFNK